MPPPCQQSCFPYRALSVRVRGGVGRGWHRPRLSNSCIPAPQTPPGAWPLHSGKADPRDPWTPPGQLRAGLPTQHGQGLSSGQPATMCHAAPPMKAPLAPPSCSSSSSCTCQTQGSTQVYRDLLPRETSLVSLVLAGRWHPGPRPEAVPTSKGRSCF